MIGMLGAAWWLGERVVRSALLETVDRQLGERAEALADLIECEDGWLLAEEEARQRLSEQPFSGVYARAGLALLARGSGLGSDPQPAWLSALGGTPGPRTLPGPGPGSAFRVLTVTRRARVDDERPPPELRTVRAGPDGEIVVLVAEDLIFVEHVLDRLQRGLALAAPLLLLLGALGAWLSTRRIVRPLTAMARHAEQVAPTGDGRVPLTGSGDELDRLAGALNDAFDRLRTAYRQQALFTTGAAHELRTPVATALSQAEVALRRERPAEVYRQTLTEVVTAARRLLSIIEALERLTRPAGAPDVVALGPLIDEVIESAGAPTLQRLGAADARVDGDAEQLRIVLANLVSNAVRHAGPDGVLSVDLQVAPDRVWLVVADDGPGIPAEHQPHLFEPFYRVDPGRGRGSGGSGLGLALVRAIVTAHGGEVHVDSAPGRGTRMRVELPT